MWDLVERLARDGDTPAAAMRKIKVACGESASLVFIMNAAGKHGVCPKLVNNPANKWQLPGMHPS